MGHNMNVVFHAIDAIQAARRDIDIAIDIEGVARGCGTNTDAGIGGVGDKQVAGACGVLDFESSGTVDGVLEGINTSKALGGIELGEVGVVA